MDYIIIIIIILLLLVVYWDTILINLVVILTVKRGITATNCRWWGVSDLYSDNAGTEIYNKLKHKYGNFVPVNIIGQKMYVVTNVKHVQYILNNSPNMFGVGKFKYNFFKPFMSLNVGVSQGCPWAKRRVLNEQVLSTSSPKPIFYKQISQIVRDKMSSDIPTNYKQFSELGEKITMKIVFNEDKVFSPIFEMISSVNELSFAYKESSSNKDLSKKYTEYIVKHLNNPNEGSLVYLAKSMNKGLTLEELLHQVPHWIFPLKGLVSVSLPRVLLLLYNHPQVFNKVIKEINQNRSDVTKLVYLRWCILETLRLNNTVNSTFRTLLKDYSFDGSRKSTFSKGTQFVIFNIPFMHDSNVFPQPNKFIPDRWTPQLEDSYHSIMFSQGPQMCPGKNISIYVIQTLVVNYLDLTGVLKDGISKIKMDSMDTINIRMINPCKIKINF